MTTFEIVLSFISVLLMIGTFNLYRYLEKVMGRVHKLEKLNKKKEETIETVDSIIEKQLAFIKCKTDDEFQLRIEKLFDEIEKTDIKDIEKEKELEELVIIRPKFNTLKNIQNECRKGQINKGTVLENNFTWEDWETHWNNYWNGYRDNDVYTLSLNPPWKHKY